jgi:soluble lytic murein transglycosylase-like protein
MRKLILASSVMAILCTDAAVNATANNFTAVKTPLMHESVDNRAFQKVSSSNVPEMVRRAAIKEGVPVRFALAVAEQESHFRCNAVGAAGERGVMQIKPATARGIGYKGTSRGLNNCQIGIYWGMKYLKMAITEAKGDLKRAAFLYNAGINAKSRNPHKKKYVISLFSRKSLTE